MPDGADCIPTASFRIQAAAAVLTGYAHCPLGFSTSFDIVSGIILANQAHCALGLSSTQASTLLQSHVLSSLRSFPKSVLLT